MEIVSIEEVPVDARAFVWASATSARAVALAQLRRHNPCWTLKQLGAQMGVSGERIRQLLVAQGLGTRHKRACVICKEVRPISAFRNSGRNYLAYVCTPCWDARQAQLKANRRGTFFCGACGKELVRKISAVINNMRRGGHGQAFCNRVCFGKFTAKTAGWASPQAFQRREQRYVQARAELPPGYALLMDRTHGLSRNEQDRWKSAARAAGVLMRLPSGLLAIPSDWK